MNQVNMISRCQQTFAGRLARGAWIGCAASAALLLLGATPALAQDGQPATGAAPQEAQQATPATQTRSPFWGDDAYDRAPRRDDRRYRDDDYDDYRRTFEESFPVDLAAEVAPARERYMALRWAHSEANSRLGERLRHLRRMFEESEEYRSLLRERDELVRQQQAAREQALAPLANDPQYQALLDLERDLASKIQELHQSPNRDMEQIRGMSELAMIYSRQRREMENGLTGSDGEIDSSRQRLTEIHQRQRELEAEYDRELRNDEQLAMLRDQVDQLRISYLAAGAYYDSAVRTANIATRFAYFNALTQGYAYSPYGYGGYGGYGGFGFGHGFKGGGAFVIPSLVTGEGPIRVRPLIFPEPIISNTFQGVNQFPRPVPTSEPPPFPDPDEN